ncbi:Uu.00g143290.m01.CDS01 [Anthostomella pinea]|uniref:Uu.00g143290.m01.CDS01 n=1 Tax=Anthostomella pinea TaxID=933095 RepID=A0AAI8YLI7_9PEZI|nr:Uu.00g143290.m01.CDS01 [Anthostomella pinea]
MAEEPKSFARKRRRPAKSCEPCRSPSIIPKVDLVRDISEDLLAVHNEGQPGSQDPGSPLRSPEECSRDLRARIRSLENIARPEGSSNDQGSPGQAIRDLEERVSRVEQQLSVSKRDQARISHTGLQVTLPRPHLRAEKEKTRLFGQTHWVHSLEQFHLLARMQAKTSAAFDGQQNGISSSIKEGASARQLAQNRGTGRLQELMPGLPDTIPPRSVCDEAVNAYLHTFEPMFRILHIPSFLHEYDEHWSHSDSPQSIFLMKLLMVLTIGAIFLPDRTISNQIRRAAREWSYVVQWWLVGPTEREAMCLDGVQVFCLLILARQTTSLGGSSSIATEALLKLCFTIGLHLEPRTIGSRTVFQSEMRRRLWITVLELTTITSMNSTLPLLISLDDYQCEQPSNTSDTGLKEGDPYAALEVSELQNLDCSLQLLLAKSLRLRMQITRELNTFRREFSYQKALDYGNALKAQCREIAEFFQARSCDNDDWHPALGFHHKFFDSYLRRIILVLHRPFAMKARNDPQFFFARKACLESCTIISSHAKGMNFPSGEVDDFSYLCMSGTGLFKGFLGQDILCALAFEVTVLLEEEGSGERMTLSTSATYDPLISLSRASREPLMKTLDHIREQWRQIICLGRPSLKQYLFLSTILSQIRATEAGQDPKEAIIQTVKTTLAECLAMLQESGVYTNTASSSSLAGWTDGTSPFDVDMSGLFGFDLHSLDPTLTLDIPDWLDDPNMAPSMAT